MAVEQVLHEDYETYSECDLKSEGAHKYAMHPSTEILCLAYAFNDEEPELWVPGDPLPSRLMDHILFEEGRIEAWNSEFERLLTRHVAGPRYGFPTPNDDAYECVMTRALAMGFPGALANAAPALGLETRKDAVGRRIMLQLCKPRTTTKTDKRKRFTPNMAPRRFEILYDYCKQDVRVERECGKRLVRLKPKHRALAVRCSQINDRGVPVDMELIRKAQIIVDQQSSKLDAEMREVTGGEVQSCSAVTALIRWLAAGGLVWPTNDVPSVAKDPLARLLVRDDLTNSQRVALELRQEAAKTSTAKLDSFEGHVCADGRVRGTLQFNGTSTGRDAARGVQVQNFPRPNPKTPIKEVIADILNGADAELIELKYGPPMSIISDILRSCIKTPNGRKFYAHDLSQIEARMTAYLGRQDHMLEAFRAYDRKEGPDIYSVAAGGIYGKPASLVDKNGDERQVGKVSVLALGFGGGAGAFGSMAKIYQLDLKPLLPIVWRLSDVEQQERAVEAYEKWGRQSGMHRDAWLASEIVKLKWRADNPSTVKTWYDLENAAVEAMLNPGSTHVVGLLQIRKTGSFLRLILPSGRSLFFPYPRLEWTTSAYGRRKATIYYKAIDSFTRQWFEFSLWGGLIFQNAVQAASADVLFDIVVRLEEAGYPNIMRVHDEPIHETADDFGDEEEFHRLFVAPIEWAPELPIAGAGWVGERYRK